jgi:CheY-like chemotaxis protein
MADVLIVDDDPDLAWLLGEAVEAEGHDVRIAQDGWEALRRVHERAPDLLLLDVEMPVLSGPELSIELLLRDCGEENIPIVLLSGVVGLARVAAGVGTPYYLAKPYEADGVIRILERALRERVPPRPGRAP